MLTRIKDVYIERYGDKYKNILNYQIKKLWKTNVCYQGDCLEGDERNR